MNLQETFINFSISLDAYSALIGLFILIYISIKRISTLSNEKWLIITLVFYIVMSVSDIFTFLFEGNSNPVNYKVLPIAMFIYYLSTFAIMVSYVVYVITSSSFTRNRKIYLKLIMIGACLYMTLLIISQFTHIIYTIDDNNHYSRGKYFFVSMIFEILLYIAIVALFIHNRKDFDKSQTFSLFSFIFFPVVMQIAQIILLNLSLVTVGYTFAFLITFVNMNNNLEEVIDIQANEVTQKNAQIIRMQEHTILSLSNLVENRDTDTGEHIKRTSAYVEMLATKLLIDGYLQDIITSRYIALIEKAAPMHDIGKIVISDMILKKPERLTQEEFLEMQKHTIAGRKIVYQILDDYEDPKYVKICADIAAYHHEKWDGSGYPEHLKGEAIPLCARIMAIADVFDALVSPRVYKAPMSYDEAFGIIEKGAGIHFDPVLSKAFLSIKDRIIAICESYKSSEALIHDLEELEEV